MKKLNTLDEICCILYLISVLFIGCMITLWYKRKNRSSESINAYYLGNQQLPWWALAIADVSSYIDIAGTMINTALLYALGTKGMYIEIRGGLCLMLAFQLAFTGKLSRRCPIRTKGEWIKFRYGTSTYAIWARTSVALVCLIGSTFAITYFAIGGGKFITEFFDIPSWLGLSSEFWGAGILMCMAMTYTIIGGFSTVVYTDVYQSLFIFSSFLYVAILAMQKTLPNSFFIYLPEWISTSNLNQNERKLEYFNSTSSLAFDPFLLPTKSVVKTWINQTSWTTLIPPTNLHLPSNISYSIYNDFQFALLCYFIMNFMRSSSGPGSGGLQTVLATKSIKEVRLQTALAMCLLAFRWAFSAGIAILAINETFYHQTTTLIEPERVVPWVIASILPHGMKGIVTASLLAAAMTTFDSTVNVASSYWTIDIYQALINPKASSKSLMIQARCSSLILILMGLFLSLCIPSINRIWGIMTMALGGGTIWSYFFSWYWYRFNAIGFVTGLLSGVITTIILFIWYPHITEYSSFLITSAISCSLSVLTSLCTSSTDRMVLKRFYLHVRPPGIWNDVSKRMTLDSATRSMIHKENRFDLISVCLILFGQLFLYFLSVSIVMKVWYQSLYLTIGLIILFPLIYIVWYRRLDQEIFIEQSILNRMKAYLNPFHEHLHTKEDKVFNQMEIKMETDLYEPLIDINPNEKEI